MQIALHGYSKTPFGSKGFRRLSGSRRLSWLKYFGSIRWRPRQEMIFQHPQSQLDLAIIDFSISAKDPIYSFSIIAIDTNCDNAFRTLLQEPLSKPSIGIYRFGSSWPVCFNRTPKFTGKKAYIRNDHRSYDT